MHTKVLTLRIGSIPRRGNAMGWHLSASLCLAADTDPNTAVVCITQQSFAVPHSSSSDG
jgi:hypothetical protein